MTGAGSMARIGLAVVVAIVVAAAAGCAGGASQRPAAEGAGSGGISPAGGQALIDAQAQYARCLRRHGVDMPGPGEQEREFDPRAVGVSDEKMRTAEGRCELQRRAIAQAAPKVSDADRRAQVDAGLRYARCMRQHGQDVPDPRLSDPGGGMSVEVPSDAKRNPAFEAAAHACEEVLREVAP
jgi:hypothetical protein